MPSLWKLAVIGVLIATGVYFLKQNAKGGWCHSTARIDHKVAIVTGGNTGIGRETALDLVRRGGDVVLACRSMDRGQAAADYIVRESGVQPSRVVVMQLDLSSVKSVRKFAADFKQRYKNLHILINNAGVMMTPYTKTEDGFELQFATNHLGHFLLTNLLLDTLKASSPARVVTVSSLAHAGGTINFDDIHSEKDYGSIAAYGRSKLANILFSRQLAKVLKGTGVTTYSLHPGSIDTELTRYNYLYIDQLKYLWMWLLKTPTEGAQTSICCAVDPNLANVSGRYYQDCAEVEPYTSEATDDDVAERLWNLSVQLVGL